MAVTAVAMTLLLDAPAALAAPVSGERETVEMTYTTTEPGAPSGFTYSASFRDPSNASADPPSLRRLVIGAPPGARIDTTVRPRCDATDDELKQQAEAACPPESRIGEGMAQVKPILFPAVAYRATLFNADQDQLELLTGDPPAPPVVVHGYIRGEVVDSPIPTCLNGGFVPQDCPDDQAALLSNTLSVPLVATGTGAARRGYLTTPPSCPASGAWRSPITFHYGDGAVETLVTEQPCAEPAAEGRDRRARLSVRVRRPVARTSRRIRSLRATIRVRGAPRADGVRAAVRRIGRGGRRGGRQGRLRRPVTVRGRRVVTLRLRRRGLPAGRYELAVRARDANRAVRYFRIRR